MREKQMEQVRGWHGGCPAAERGMLGTYALVGNPDGTVFCEVCGAQDLLPREEAIENRLKPRWLKEFRKRVKKGLA